MNNACVIALILLAGTTLAVAGDDPASLAEIYGRMNRVLVTVEYKSELTFMGQSDEIEGRVIGLSVGRDGLVIFNGSDLSSPHFGADAIGAPRVEKPKSLKVTDFRDSIYDAEFIGVDDYTSIAFCRLPDSTRSHFQAAEFEKIDMSLGDLIYVFWMLPKGFQPRFQMTRSFVTSVVSKPEQYYLTGELPPEFVMAPVVTGTGRLAGIITFVEGADSRFAPARTGNGFGEPVLGILSFDRIQKLLAKPPIPGEFKRGWMGIALQALDPEVAAFWNIAVKGGIVIADVTAGSPAEKAGINPGDFLIAVDGAPLEITRDDNLSVFQKMITDMGAEADFNVTLVRPGEDKKVDTIFATVVLGETPVAAGDAERYEDKNFDLTVRDMVFADFNLYNLDPLKTKGVVVDKMESGGWAGVGGIDPGDIIIKINDQAVGSVTDARAVFEELEKTRKKDVVFMVLRNKKTQFVNVKTHWK